MYSIITWQFVNSKEISRNMINTGQIYLELENYQFIRAKSLDNETGTGYIREYLAQLDGVCFCTRSTRRAPPR